MLLPRTKKKKTTRKISINREVYKPNQLWQFDIRYGYLHDEQRFFFILVYIDVYSRKNIHHYVCYHCKTNNLLATLSIALSKSGISGDDLVIRSDNGPQMSSNDFRKQLAKINDNIEHEFIPCSTPNKNAHVKSFYSILETEFIRVNYFVYSGGIGSPILVKWIKGSGALDH